MASRQRGKSKKKILLSPELDRLHQTCLQAAKQNQWPALLQILQRQPSASSKAAPIALLELRALEKLQALPQLLDRSEALSKAFPRDARFWSFYSHALRLNGQIEAAVEPLRKAVKLAGADAALFNSLGSALKETGQFDEARNWLERSIKLDPTQAKAWWNLSDIRDDHAPAVDALQKLLARPDLKEPELVHFSLFRHLDRLGDLDLAFEHLAKANQIRHQRFQPDAAQDRKLTDAICGFFEQRPGDQSGRPDQGQQALFVFGMPRSGTTLVEQILACHSRVKGGNELTALNLASARVRAEHHLNGEFPQWLESLNADGWQQIGNHYLQLTDKLRGDSPRLTDKSLLNYRAAGLIHGALPAAHMVHVRRNVCDQAFGLYKQNFGDGILFSYSFDNIASAIADHNRLLELWQRVLPASHYHPIEYDSLVTQPDLRIPELLVNCELPAEDACLSPHQTERSVRTLSATQVREPINTRSLDAWRKYEKHLQPMLDALNQYDLI